jgi:hypothetical protein
MTQTPAPIFGYSQPETVLCPIGHVMHTDGKGKILQQFICLNFNCRYYRQKFTIKLKQDVELIPIDEKK